MQHFLHTPETIDIKIVKRCPLPGYSVQSSNAETHTGRASIAAAAAAIKTTIT
jgi:hypothetical protein